MKKIYLILFCMVGVLPAMQQPPASIQQIKSEARSLVKTLESIEARLNDFPFLKPSCTKITNQVSEEVHSALQKKRMQHPEAQALMRMLKDVEKVFQETELAFKKKIVEKNILAELSVANPLDGKRTDLELRARIDIDVDRYVQVKKNPAIFLYQYPCLNQHAVKGGTVQSGETTNYCGYYALYHARCFASNASQTALVDRAQFVQYMRLWLPIIGKGRKHDGYDNLDGEEIKRLVDDASGLAAAIAVVEQQFVQGYLEEAPGEIPLAQQLIDFKQGTRSLLTLIYAYGAAEGHWLTIHLKRDKNTITCILTDSLGVLDWLSSDGIQLLWPLYEFLAK